MAELAYILILTLNGASSAAINVFYFADAHECEAAGKAWVQKQTPGAQPANYLCVSYTPESRD